MNPYAWIRQLRWFGIALLVANVLMLFNVKGRSSPAATWFFLVSAGMAMLGSLVYLVARFRTQNETTRNVIEAITPLAMLGFIVMGTAAVLIVIPSILNALL